MAEKSSPGTRQTDGKNLVFFINSYLYLPFFRLITYFMIFGIVSEMTAVSGVCLIYPTKQYFRGLKKDLCYVYFSMCTLQPACIHYFVSFPCCFHRLINFKDTKTKCRHIKKWTCIKGLCGRCLSEFIDWRYSQSCWYFRPIFVNYCPFNLLSGSPAPTPPPVPLPSVNVQYIQTVCDWEGLGCVESGWRPYSAWG
jgi:hypothetical protein